MCIFPFNSVIEHDRRLLYRAVLKFSSTKAYFMSDYRTLCRGYLCDSMSDYGVASGKSLVYSVVTELLSSPVNGL